MISFFTIPRAFDNKYNDIQIASIQSWLTVDDDIEIWLVGNESGVRKVSDFLGPRVRHIPGINRSPWKTPLIDDAFYQVMDVASYDILCYVNTDIFHRGHIPPFAVGRSAWDNWLLMDAQTRGMKTIDATRTIGAFHLGQIKRHHTINDEYRYNQRLWAENGGRDRAGWVDSTEWVTKPGKSTPVVLHHRGDL